MSIDFPTFIGYVSEWLGAVAVAWIFSINPIFQRQPLGFRFPRREGIISLGLFALILVATFAYFNFYPPQFVQDKPLGPAPILDLSQALVVSLIALLPVLIALFARGQPPRSTGWDFSLLRAALPVGVATALLIIFLRNRIMDFLTNGLTVQSLTMLVISIALALAETTVFQGYLQPRLSSWLGDWAGIGLSALLFTVWRLPGWLGFLPSETIWILLGLTFAQGLVLGWIMYKCRNVVAPGLYRAVSIWLRLL